MVNLNCFHHSISCALATDVLHSDPLRPADLHAEGWIKGNSALQQLGLFSSRWRKWQFLSLCLPRNTLRLLGAQATDPSLGLMCRDESNNWEGGLYPLEGDSRWVCDCPPPFLALSWRVSAWSFFVQDVSVLFGRWHHGRVDSLPGSALTVWIPACGCRIVLSLPAPQHPPSPTPPHPTPR